MNEDTKQARLQAVVDAIGSLRISDEAPAVVEQLARLAAQIRNRLTPRRATVRPSDGAQIRCMKAIQSVTGSSVKEAKELTEGSYLKIPTYLTEPLERAVKAEGGEVVWEC